MAFLEESPIWEEGIYQYEEDDPLQGGADGIDNIQGKQLANRTRYLKEMIETLSASVIEQVQNQLDGFTSNIEDLSATGIPPGGTTGQIIAKASNRDFDVQWTDKLNVGSGGGGTEGGSDSGEGNSGSGKVTGSEINPWSVSLINKGGKRFTIADNATLAGNTGQEIEYALSLSSAQSPDNPEYLIQSWKMGENGTVKWENLHLGTEYYIWARSREHPVCTAGTARSGGAVTTNNTESAEELWEVFIGAFIDKVGISPNPSYVAGPAHGGGTYAFYGGVLAPNGKVIFVPYGSPNIGIYDPIANTFTLGPAHGQGTNVFYGGVLAPNGKVIFVGSGKIGIYDPIANTFTAGPAHGQGSNVFISAVLVFCPIQTTNKKNDKMEA